MEKTKAYNFLTELRRTLTWSRLGILTMRSEGNTPSFGGLRMVVNRRLHMGQRDSTFAHSIMQMKQKKCSQLSIWPLIALP